MSRVRGSVFFVVASIAGGIGLLRESSRIATNGIERDVLGLLDVLDHELAFLAGHDHGSWVSWHLPLLHPEAFVRRDESHHRRSLTRLVRSFAIRRRVVRRDRAAESV